MTAREKIQGLTNSWYGWALVSGIFSLLRNGIGFFSLFMALGSTLFSFALTYFLGNRLLARSGFTRGFLIFASSVCMLLSALATFRFGAAFLQNWTFALLGQIAVMIVSFRMNFKSFRVLTDSSVKTYFR